MNQSIFDDLLGTFNKVANKTKVKPMNETVVSSNKNSIGNIENLAEVMIENVEVKNPITVKIASDSQNLFTMAFDEFPEEEFMLEQAAEDVIPHLREGPDHKLQQIKQYAIDNNLPKTTITISLSAQLRCIH